MASLKQRVDTPDREIAAIRKLLMAGAKWLVKSDQRHEQHMLRMEGMHEVLKQEQIALRKELRELAASRRETRRELQALIRSLRGGNGHLKTRIE